MLTQPLKPQRQSGQRVQLGFTLVESVAVVLLLAILAAVVAPTAFNASALSLGPQARGLAADLQKAQWLGMTSGQAVYLCVPVNQGYLVQVGAYAPGQACPSVLPSATSPSQPVVTALESGLTLAANPTALQFKGLGEPHTAASYQLQTSGGASRTLSVSAITAHISESVSP